MFIASLFNVQCSMHFHLPGSWIAVNSTSSPTRISRVWKRDWNDIYQLINWIRLDEWLNTGSSSISREKKLTVSKTSVKWKNIRTLRSTHRKNPKPSLSDETMPCSRLSPDNSNVSSSREIDVARCNWSRRSVASKNWTQSPWRRVKSPFCNRKNVSFKK